MIVDMMRSSVVVVPDVEDGRVEEDDELYVGVEHQTTSKVSSRDHGSLLANDTDVSTLCEDCCFSPLYPVMLLQHQSVQNSFPLVSFFTVITGIYFSHLGKISLCFAKSQPVSKADRSYGISLVWFFLILYCVLKVSLFIFSLMIPMLFKAW
jgi:hypothetical protein